jgi:23S rRNA-/tRNA-specific pseudouridylate synthase
MALGHPLSILFEDPHLLVSKPRPRRPPAAGHRDATLVNPLFRSSGQPGRPSRPRPPLDKDTSILVIAKTDEAMAKEPRQGMKELFEKEYLVVHGTPRFERRIDLEFSGIRGIERMATSGCGRASTPSTRSSGESSGGAPGSLLRCRLVTGRTHRRVHLKAMPPRRRRSRLRFGTVEGIRTACSAAWTFHQALPPELTLSIRRPAKSDVLAPSGY